MPNTPSAEERALDIHRYFCACGRGSACDEAGILFRAIRSAESAAREARDQEWGNALFGEERAAEWLKARLNDPKVAAEGLREGIKLNEEEAREAGRMKGLNQAARVLDEDCGCGCHYAIAEELRALIPTSPSAIDGGEKTG